MPTNKVNVTINSRMYTVVSSETPEYIKSLGDHINEKVNLVIRDGKNIIGERPMVLAALNICDEYFKVLRAGEVMSEQTKNTNDKLRELQSEAQKRREKNKELCDEISRLNQQNKSFSDNIDALKQENASQKQEIAKLKEELTDLLMENRRLNDRIKR